MSDANAVRETAARASAYEYAQQMFPLAYGHALWMPFFEGGEDGQSTQIGTIAALGMEGLRVLDSSYYAPPECGDSLQITREEISDQQVLWGATIAGDREANCVSCGVCQYDFTLLSNTGGFLVTSYALHEFVQPAARSSMLPCAVERLFRYRETRESVADAGDDLIFITGTVKASRYRAAHIVARTPGVQLHATLTVALSDFHEYECEYTENQHNTQQEGGASPTRDREDYEDERADGRRGEEPEHVTASRQDELGAETPVIERRSHYNAFPTSESSSVSAPHETLFIHYFKMKTRRSCSAKGSPAQHHDPPHIPLPSAPLEDCADDARLQVQNLMSSAEEATVAVASDTDVLALFWPKRVPADLPHDLTSMLERRRPCIVVEDIAGHKGAHLRWGLVMIAFS
ncbi:uncharacterized protein TRAVEDRAFT_49875 [Trametes versicolor FP-101664 SS1]|uniref:uncharacterized protein n=1 Tax=Trametes versicolor (strain FP-101664) TaxID=717944 RepID=UPI0004623988|nr:uncharacterized protein TRAVEDRAFT_49875 [Trametes versicolor FP-101664 SS1]EIW57065.1 hypothetical protein TRAVEDRAFT_49875 [Trametes versicolor FP-101664 SS1]